MSAPLPPDAANKSGDEKESSCAGGAAEVVDLEDTTTTDTAPPILVSACLAGTPCRYDGKSCHQAAIGELVSNGRAIAVCPEVLGGLTTPRAPAEIVYETEDANGTRHVKVQCKDGVDVTEQFQRGAQKALEVAQRHGCVEAILKGKSPSCGVGMVYDGRFGGQLRKGHGVTAHLLMKHGIRVRTEDTLL